MSWWSRLVERHWPPRWLYTTYERQVLDALDRDSLPQHVAVLADGNRRWARLNAPGQPLVSPAFALDGGEEPEIAAFYLIDNDGTANRIGCAEIYRNGSRVGTCRARRSRPGGRGFGRLIFRRTLCNEPAV